MVKINPYLIFNGRCREAMMFYKECFGGELTLQSVGESPMADQWPDAMQDQVLHASLVNETFVILASDMGGTEQNSSGPVMLAVACNDDREIEACFERLSVNGKVIHPLHRFYDGTIGSLTDKFGMSWVLKC